MKMYLCDVFYNLEVSSYETMEEKKRVISNPKFVPNAGDFVYLGYSPCTRVEQVIYDYEHDMIIVIAYKK